MGRRQAQRGAAFPRLGHANHQNTKVHAFAALGCWGGFYSKNIYSFVRLQKIKF